MGSVFQFNYLRLACMRRFWLRKLILLLWFLSSFQFKLLSMWWFLSTISCILKMGIFFDFFAFIKGFWMFLSSWQYLDAAFAAWWSGFCCFGSLACQDRLSRFALQCSSFSLSLSFFVFLALVILEDFYLFWLFFIFYVFYFLFFCTPSLNIFLSFHLVSCLKNNISEGKNSTIWDLDLI